MSRGYPDARRVGGKQVDKRGETSDGYHTFNELYDHRHTLFMALMRSHPNISWRAEKHEDDTMYDGWFIAGMHLSTGDISYHLPIEYWRALSSIDHYYHAPHWDGHTPADVVARLKAWDLPSMYDEAPPEQEQVTDLQPSDSEAKSLSAVCNKRNKENAND